MKHIRTFSPLLTLMTLLGAAFSAPYLIPADPESAVFRSGTLALILFIACASPIYHALRTHTFRSLVYGIVFGFVFALALSIGSELAFYNQLLPGMGSLIRRFAAPVMMTPLLGVLASYAFALQVQPEPQKRREIPAIAFFLLIAAGYTLVLLAFYPGVITYDFPHEIRQFRSGAFEAAHPVGHTLFLGGLFALGEALFGTMNAGSVLYCAVQFSLLAAMYAWVCAFVQRRVRCKLIAPILCACFAILPFHSILSISTGKDPLFGGLCTVLCCLLWAAGEDAEAFLASKRRLAAFCAVCLAMALLRHNGLFAFIPACLALLLLARRMRKRALALILCALAFAVVTPKALEAAVGAKKAPSSEMMSIPCQQLMRTAAVGNVTEEEYEELSAWFSGAIHRYWPYCADAAKGGNFAFARYQEDPGAFWQMYLRYGMKYPRVYAEAFLFNCIGLWYPDDTSHAHSLGSEEYDYVYMTTTYSYGDDFPIDAHSLLPALHRVLYDVAHHSKHQQIPFIAQLFCPAIYSFLILFVTLKLAHDRRGRMALTTLPLWGIFASLLFSAGIFVRYAYPLMAAAPVLLILTLFADKKAA